MISEKVKFRVGNYLHPVTLHRDNGRIFFDYQFNPGINEMIKLMEGRQYHGYDGAPMREYVLKVFRKDKMWSAPETEHNQFRIDYLTGKKPYATYKRPLESFDPYFEVLRSYQVDMTAQMLTRKCCVIAGEPGIGKTLSFMEAAELVNPKGIWYVASKSALRGVQKDKHKWGIDRYYEFMTYNGLTNRMNRMAGQEFTPPQMVCFDECHALKSPTSQRSLAAEMLARYVREQWGDEAYVIGMSGSCSPNNPLDWWMQSHIIRPGFLIEGNIHQLRERLAVTIERDFGTGVHKAIVTWKDRDDVCDICGKKRTDHDNDPFNDTEDPHEFKLAKNEVGFLYKRLVENGLVMVKLKKDCLDLPPKFYDEITVEPSKTTLDIARALVAGSPTSAEALIRVCALSDGFQYNSVKTGEEKCPICSGTGESLDFVIRAEYADQPLPDPDSEEGWTEKYFVQAMMPCIRCNGKKVVDVFERSTIEIATPKEEVFREVLDEYSEIGRVVAYGAYQGSIDRMVRVAKQLDWNVIKADGRGWWSDVENIPKIDNQIDYLGLFQDGKSLASKVAFIGHPGSAGEGLTLTASPVCFYYSKTFNAVHLLQSQDRIHRLGMDETRGARILSCFHLPTDRLVHNKLVEKIARQDLTLGVNVDMNEIMQALEE